MPGNSLVDEFSIQIYNAGRTRSYVIGHNDKSNPNINGAKTTIEEQYYRHGERSIHNNGKLLKKTTEKGVIYHDEIQGLIK